MRRLLPALPALFLPSLDAAVLSSLDETWDLRADVGIAIIEEDLVGSDFEFDTALDLSVTVQNRLAFSGSQRGLYLVWGVGAGIPYQTGEDDALSIDWYALVGRYYLGLGYEFTDAMRLQAVPYGGAGAGYMDASIEGVGDADDFAAVGELGLRIDFLFSTGSLEFGVGVAPLIRKSNYDLDSDAGNINADMDQDYIEAHFMLGWEF